MPIFFSEFFALSQDTGILSQEYYLDIAVMCNNRDFLTAVLDSHAAVDEYILRVKERNAQKRSQYRADSDDEEIMILPGPPE